MGRSTVVQALKQLDQLGATRGRKGRPRMVIAPEAPAATRYEQVAAQLRQWIGDGTFATGGRLPAETELAVRLAVSRSTVRQAMRLLEVSGDVVQRAGRRYAAGASETPDLAHEQVTADLRRSIRSHLPEGRLPGELALAAKYGVSRPTVRRALSQLASEGLVHSVPKLGWFVMTSKGRRDG